MSNQIVESNKKDRRLSIFVLYVVMTFTVYILPYTKYVLPYILVALLMLASMPFIMRKNTEWVTYSIMLVCLSIILMFVLMLKELTFVNGVNEFIRHIRFFLPVLWGGYAIKYCNKKQKIFVLICFAVITVFVFFRTLQALSENEWIARLLAESTSTSSMEINSYRLENVGGFEFSYMIGLVTLCIAWLIFNARRIYVRIICALLTVFCYYYIIQTMYTTLLILTTVCLALMLLFYVKNPMIRVLGVGVAVVFLFLLPSITLKLSDLFGNSLLADKFLLIHHSLTGGGAESLGSRPERMFEAFVEFAKSPIWGGNNVAGDAHSLFFHTLANYGIIGVVALVVPFVKGRDIIISGLKRNNCSTLLFDIACVYIVLLSIFNPIGYVFEVTITVFFIVPIFVDATTNIIKSRSDRL